MSWGKIRKRIYFILLGWIYCLDFFNEARAQIDQGTNFFVIPISLKMKSQLLKNKVWNPDCPVPIAELRLVGVSYYDLSGHAHSDGRLIVRSKSTAAVTHLFQDLYTRKFPLSSVDTLLTFSGNWQQAEKQDVTYGFSCRKDPNDQYAPESFGNVLTINPVENPEIILNHDNNDQQLISSKPDEVSIFPSNGVFYVNRRYRTPGMLDGVKPLFKKNGFIPLDQPKHRKLSWGKFVYERGK